MRCKDQLIIWLIFKNQITADSLFVDREIINSEEMGQIMYGDKFLFKYQKLEEHDFRIKQLNMEKGMRKEEREHELNMLRLLIVPQAPPSVPLPSSSPFSLPVSGFLSSSPATSQSIKDSCTMNYSTNPSGEMATYFKL